MSPSADESAGPRPEAPIAGRPSLGWSDLAAAKVGVWGLGVEGRANLRRLATLGVRPVLVDDRPPPDGEQVEGIEVLRTGDGGLDALSGCEVVVKTPGISRYRPEVAELQARGIAVVGGVGLWLQEADRDRVVVITGTKGKSTTTSVLAHLLTRLGRTAVASGNLGQPPHDPALDARRDTVDYWIVEVSSFQATDLAVTPPVTVATSLHADHLDWHGTIERYVTDKLSALSQPGARVTVANGTSDLLRLHRAELGPRVRWVGGPGDVEPAWVGSLGLLGAHNRLNARLAGACLEELGVAGAADGDRLAAASQGFEGLPSRLRVVASHEGVDFVDDSLSSNVLPVLAALDAFGGRPMALLVGGFDRGIDYSPLADHLAARTTPTLVLTLPDSGPRIAAAVEAVLAAGPGPGAPVEVRRCEDLASAVGHAYRFARPAGGVVLLSPAAPSFGRFRDYKDRAEAFAAAVREVVKPPPAVPRPPS